MLLYKGMQIVKEVPQNKMVGYFVLVIIGAIVVSMITGAIMVSLAYGSHAMMPM